MHSCWIVLFTLLLAIQNVSVATVSGRILDQEGKPLAGAQITYKNIGRYNREYRADGGMRTENPEMTEGTGRVYHTKTDRRALSSWQVWTLVSIKLRLPARTEFTFIRAGKPLVVTTIPVRKTY